MTLTIGHDQGWEWCWIEFWTNIYHHTKYNLIWSKGLTRMVVHGQLFEPAVCLSDLYDVFLLDIVRDTRQNLWSMIYRSQWPPNSMRSLTVSDWTSIQSMMHKWIIFFEGRWVGAAICRISEIFFYKESAKWFYYKESKSNKNKRAMRPWIAHLSIQAKGQTSFE